MNLWLKALWLPAALAAAVWLLFVYPEHDKMVWILSHSVAMVLGGVVAVLAGRRVAQIGGGRRTSQALGGALVYVILYFACRMTWALVMYALNIGIDDPRAARGTFMTGEMLRDLFQVQLIGLVGTPVFAALGLLGGWLATRAGRAMRPRSAGHATA